MHEAGYVDYLEHLVPLPLLDIIICPYLDYYILSIFHYLGSPLSYHTLIFDLMSSRNMYLYNAYIYTYILLHYGIIAFSYISIHDTFEIFPTLIMQLSSGGWLLTWRDTRESYVAKCSHPLPGVLPSDFT